MLSITALVLALCGAQDPSFRAILWPKGEGVSALAQQFRAVCVGRSAKVDALREAGVRFLVFNAPGRNVLHLERERDGHAERMRRWQETRDPALLVRAPCLTAPTTRERMFELLDESLAARGGDPGLGLSLGDEVGLTPGGAPEDVCLSPSCRARWELWCQARGVAPGSAPELASIDTDATLRALFEGRTAALGDWLARREFHQDVVLGLLGELAARVHAGGAPAGLLGLSGQSAFGGVAVERILPQLDFIECYRVGNARELAFTLREPRQRVYLTVFADERGPDWSAWQAWEHWLRGGDGLFVWSEVELERRPAHATRLLRALADIERVGSVRVGARPQPRGVALVHSPRSLAAGWLRDALLDGATWPNRFQSWQELHGTVERARRAWLEYAEDCGAMPGALPLERVDENTVARFPLLVLPEVLVLDEAELDRLRRYARAGGRLCIDGELGWIDSRGTRRETPLAESLARLRPLVAPPEGLRTRTHGAPLNEADERFWADCGVERAPWRVAGDAARWAWITAWWRLGDASVCAALPKPRADAPGLLPTKFELQPIDGRAIEWLHPAGASGWSAELPPGDAAVFELRPAAR